MIEIIVFYALASVVVIPALFVVGSKNIFHSALWLIGSLLGVAGLYAMLAADFLFAVQLMVYAGGVMVLLLFVILLSGKPSDWAGKQVNDKAWAAGFFSVFLLALLGVAVVLWPVKSYSVPPQPSTGPLGILLLTDMLFPFELMALILVAALVGAVYFSARKSS